MSDTDSLVQHALRQMLDANKVKNAREGDDAWHAWQRAATEYWVLLNPDLARFRRSDPTRIPTVQEMRDRASILARAMEGVPNTWRLLPWTRNNPEYLARVGWFHEQMAGLYEPVEDAIARVRRDDPSGIETLVRFLEADLYCFRSGYVKADVIRNLTRVDLQEPTIERLRRVVLDVVDGYDRREFRTYIRLAWKVDSEDLRKNLRSRLGAPSSRTARHAKWILVGLGERPSSAVEAEEDRSDDDQ